MVREVTVAAVQFSCSWDTPDNIQKAKRKVKEARDKGAELILLQELFATPYFCSEELPEFFDLAGSSNPKYNNFLSEMASCAKENKVILPISFFERANSTYYNSILVFDENGEILGMRGDDISSAVYRKVHIPTGPGYQEKFFFSPSNDGFRVYYSPFLNITFGIAICWDQWFPESARIMALMGAEVILYPTAIGSEPQNPLINSKLHWQTAMRGHAASNYLPVVASNRIGQEKMIKFYGFSFICNEVGHVVQQAGEEEEEVLLQKFDFDIIKNNRASWGLIRDRRPNLYTPLISLNANSSFPPTFSPLSSSSFSSSDEMTTPRADGFYMPAEFSPHERIWIGFPYTPFIWRDGGKPAGEEFLRVVKEVSRFEEVSLCVIPHLYAAVRDRIDEWKNDQEKRYHISVLEMEYEDSWFRDTAPTFLIHPHTREVRGVDWNFNGWGEFEHQKDIHIARRVLEFAGKRRYKCPLVMEGGSFHTDGEGTLITTEECLLNPNRNPQCSKHDIEHMLKEFLGVRKIIWIKEGVYGDTDTNGHVDNLCCFIRPTEIALTFPDNPDHPQYPRSLAALNCLQGQTDAKGRPLVVHRVVHPFPDIYRSDEDISSLSKHGEEDRTSFLAASYINFLIGNRFVLIPAFDLPTDATALSQISALFPSHEVVQIPTREILFGGGNIHCITQQQPLST